MFTKQHTMKNLLLFILRNHFVLLFVLLEVVSIMLVVRYNSYQHSCFINSSNAVAGYTSSLFSSVSSYLNLRQKNADLNAEIARLRNTQLISYKLDSASSVFVADTQYSQQYEYLPCCVINNSTNNANNHLTINIGSKQGVEPGMAVIAAGGAVGVVKAVSPNFSSVISVLNQNLKVSAMLENSGYFGSLEWDGYSYRYAVLDDLPGHIKVQKGERVITSGYSSIFPKGVEIGVIDTVLNAGTNGFMAVSVKLSVDFKRLTNVQVVRNLLKKEQLELQNRAENE